MRDYEDMIDLPHHVSKNHPQMSMHDRAAQFAPFSALSGHSEAVAETARLTGRKIELDEYEKQRLDETLLALHAHIRERPEIEVTYFLSDENKEGGRYETVKTVLAKICDTSRSLLMADGRQIQMDDILNITYEKQTEDKDDGILPRKVTGSGRNH